MTARCLQCTVVVAHAAHSGEDVVDPNPWWEDLSRRLAGQPDVVLLVDANARLGSAVSAAVGSGGLCQQEDLSGTMFHRTLVELGLCVPATFGPLDDTAFTWVANGGACHRIDYVAVPGTWDCGARECSCHMVALREARDVAESCSVHVVDSAGDWEDHYLVALRAPLVIRWAPRGTQWRVEGVDRAALKGPACCSKFKSALRAIQPPSWAMSVDGHERYAAGAVCKATKAAFGAPAIGTHAGDTLAVQLGPSFATGALSRHGAAKDVFLPSRGALLLGTPPALSGCSCGPQAGAALRSWHVGSSASSLPRLPSLLRKLGSRTRSGSTSGFSCAAAGACSRGT